MALIPGYEYDIFISYAHLDNATFPGQTDGWIKQFCQNLELMLAQRFGRMDTLNIWWDNDRLDGSTLFDESIADAIRKSAIFICLNSTSYRASDYCEKELEMFYQCTQKDKIGIQVGMRSRIVHVLLNNIHFDQWPQALSGTTGHPFHDAQKKEDHGYTVDTTSPEFRVQMRKLDDAVYNLLKDFPKDKQINEVIEEVEAKVSDNSFTVYMAEVADTLRRAKKRISAELVKKGLRVIDSPPLSDSQTYDEKTLEAIRSAQLSIHLLDEIPGREVTDDPSSWYTQRQCEMAMNEPVPQLIWMPNELIPEELDEFTEPKYKEFLQGIYEGTVSGKEFEFVQGAKSSLPRQIGDYVAHIEESQKKQLKEEGPLSVLLDTHNTDHMYALDLGKTLLEHNIIPLINPQEDDPRKNIEALENRMSQVKKLVFLYGKVSKEWVLARMNAALQLIINNGYPIEDFFIYMAPPHKEADAININQRLLKVSIVNGSTDPSIDTAAVEAFLKELKTS
jgi:hypothetical protein